MVEFKNHKNMKNYRMPAIKVLAMATESVIAASGDMMLDERGVYDVYAPITNFE